MSERFRVQKRITDSGRSKVWFVIDNHKLLPPWMFNEGSGAHNRMLAEQAADLLNRGNSLDPPTPPNTP